MQNKVALVTGAGKRLGAAIAARLGAEGMRVAVHYNQSRAGADETAAGIVAAGGQAKVFGADLYDRNACRGLVDDVVAHFGALDLLVASAANFDRVAFTEIDDATWDRALALNVTAPFCLAQSAAPHLRATRGSIVMITCTSTVTPYQNYLPYVVSKGAAKQLMRTLSLELAPDVRVNAVAPGTVLPPEDTDAKTLEALRRIAPLGRLGEAADVAEAVVYLAKAPFVTGQELAVDGGRTVAAGARGDIAS